MVRGESRTNIRNCFLIFLKGETKMDLRLKIERELNEFFFV